MRKNIWLICKYACPEKYFWGTRHFYLAEEWVKNGYDVTIFTSNSSHLTNSLPKFQSNFYLEFINGVRTIWLNTLNVNNPSSILRIMSWIHFELNIFKLNKTNIPKPDIIIVSSLSILSIISGYYFAKRYKSKFILEIRDIWPLSAITLGKYSKYNPFIYFLSELERFGYLKSDLIVGTMPNLEQHVKLVEPRYKRCICIPQGIQREKILTKEISGVDSFSELDGIQSFKIGYAGTVNINNPIDVLLKAVRNNFTKDSLVEVYILGNGTMIDSFKKEYRDISWIKFLDPVPKNMVSSFLSRMDVCFDSIDSDIAKFGLSRNKWIDYMCAAKPIICSYSGYKSMINESDSGSFVPFGNERGLVDEIEKYASMGKSKLTEIGERGRTFLLENRCFDQLAIVYQNEFENV